MHQMQKRKYREGCHLSWLRSHEDERVGACPCDRPGGHDANHQGARKDTPLPETQRFFRSRLWGLSLRDHPQRRRRRSFCLYEVGESDHCCSVPLSAGHWMTAVPSVVEEPATATSRPLCLPVIV